MMKAKNNSITIWRIVFTYLIALYHFDNKYCITTMLGWKNGWYIGVEFFFIVSGFLLYQQMESLSQKCHSGLDYFIYRYRKIYPYYLGAFLLSFILYIITNEAVGVKEALKLLSRDFFEVFALHGIGLDDGWSYINNTSWFISIMLICGFIIYHCLLKWRDNFENFAVPLIIMVCFSYLYRNMRGMGAVVQIDGLYNNWALMRGMAGMCLGILSARIHIYVQMHCENTRILRLFAGAAFVFIIVFSVRFDNSTMDFLYAMIMTAAVAVAFLPSQSRIFQWSFVHRMSGVTMCIYLVHDAFRTFVFPAYLGIPESLGAKLAMMVLYLVSITIGGFILEFGVQKILAGVKVLCAGALQYNSGGREK